MEKETETDYELKYKFYKEKYNELKNDLQQFGGSFHNNNNNKALTYNKYKLNKK
jgi:hypothetical protein